MSDPDLFSRRLAWDDLNSDKLQAALSASLPDLNPDQFEAIQQWLRAAQPIGHTGHANRPREVPFVELWDIIARGALDRLVAALPANVAEQFELSKGRGRGAQIRAAMHRDLVTRLDQVGQQVLWHEFRRRRTPDQLIFAHLGYGDERPAPIRRTIYCTLLEELRADGLSDLVSRFPLLGVHLSNTLGRWVSTMWTLLQRVDSDLPLLGVHFQLPLDARLVEVISGLSDPHRGGQTVALLEFESASQPSTRRRLVYKPKDLSLDHTLQDLLGRLPPPRSTDAPLKSAAILTRGDYGYMQHIEHTPSVDDDELARFYRNAGRLTAILYLLGCTDCHHENLIAAGDQLWLVDAETLMAGGYEDAVDDLSARIADSVTALGILPQWHSLGRSHIARDVSALGVGSPMPGGQRVPGWRNLNTDAMILAEFEQPAPAATSSPVEAGQSNRLADFCSDFCAGFADQLRSIGANSSRWLGATGHLSRFSGSTRRVVLRPTWIYLWLRHRQLAPDALRSTRDQRLVLEMLARKYLLGSVRPNDWELFHSEVAQMQELDVPFFETQVDGLGITAPNGVEAPDYNTIRGSRAARRRVENLDDDAIEFQLQLIRGTIAAKFPNLSSAPPNGVGRTAAAARRAAEPSPLGEAEAIGQYLHRSAISYGHDNVEWLGIDVLDDLETFRFGPLGLSLYGGRTGVALFLAALSGQRVRNAEAYRSLALRALADLSKSLFDAGRAAQRRWWRDQPLGLVGSGGIILALSRVGELLPELGLDEQLGCLVDSLDESFIVHDDRLDIVFGLAGLIGPLLEIATPRAHALADLAGEVLVDRQHPTGGWITTPSTHLPLTGFSHGASGIAAAVVGLHRSSGTDQLRQAAEAAVAYERSTFSPSRGNWPDLRREPTGSPSFMLSWCHGAPGIALSRLCMADVLGPELDDELQRALTSTADTTMPAATDSLCCGRLGRYVILREAGVLRTEDRWLTAGRVLADEVVEGKRERGLYASIDSPGLFQGLSGIGLALLQVDDAELDLLPGILAAGLLPPKPPRQ